MLVRKTYLLFGALSIVGALSLTGCSAPQTRTSTTSPAGDVVSRSPETNGARSLIVANAERQLGMPYRYGGEGPDGFDCSGLVQYTHAQAGVQVPRVARAQHRYAQRVSLAMLKPGDLLFFRLTGKTDHVGIYVGDGEFIHAPSSGKRVSRARLDNVYWRPRLVGAGTYVTPDQ